MTGRTLFVVLARLLGLLFVLWGVVGVAQSLVWYSGGRVVAIPLLLLYGTDLVFGVVVARGADRIAAWCGWPREDDAGEEVALATVADLASAGRVLLGWTAIVWALPPLGRLLAGLVRADSRGPGPVLWDRLADVLEVLLVLAFATWLLRRGRTMPSRAT